MSTLGVRRMKERASAGGKVTAALPNSKPVTPFSEKSKVLLSTTSSLNRSTVREKPRSVSRGPAVSQKPMLRQMPIVDKSSASGSLGGDVEARRRLSSTSSVPRGRSSSPSDFARVLSDSRRARVSSVAVEQGRRSSVFQNRSSDLETSAARFRNGKGISRFRGLEKKNSKENMNSGGKLGKEYLKRSTDSTVVDEEKKLHSNSIDVNLSVLVDLNDQHQREEDPTSGRSAVPEVPIVKEPNVVVKPFQNPPCVQKTRATRPSLASKVCGKDVNGLKVMFDSKEKELDSDTIGGRVGDNYPTKLHDKLAFLEGKVKRIASDIKRTKEMLDMNNTDASKVTISDIQEKISGIEKAMSHVIRETDRNSGIFRNVDTDGVHANEEQTIENDEADIEKILVKGQDSDKLEALLFPHQMLLKGQSSIVTSTFASSTDQCRIVLSNYESSSADRAVSCPIDENPLSLEGMVSLNQWASKNSTSTCHDLEVSEVQETDDASGSSTQHTSHVLVGKPDADLELTSDELLEEFDEQENKPVIIVEEDNEDDTTCQIRELGHKASTGGWFVSEGESVLLVHDDGSCSLHDVANSEVKSEYKPPSAISSNIWSDCWVIRAPGADGCSGKYVVAASAGNTLESGFCSWDFYTKEVQAFHIEEETSNKRSVLAPLHRSIVQRRSTLSTMMSTENRQWWYRPLGPLVVSTASFQKSVQIFDIRDGERIMKWNLQKPVLNMDYSSPLQWRNKGKVVIAEADAITLWDVASLNPQALISVATSGHKISALHMCNTDAEGGGVRQRTSSSEAEGHDGVFCTADSIHILDFRQPSGIGLKIPMLGVSAQSVFSRGDSVVLGCSSVKPSGKMQSSSQVQLFSLRSQRPVSTYVLPESNAHFHHTALNQVWGNSDLVMGVCGQGLFVFDVLSDEGLPSYALDYCSPQQAKEIIGSDDLYNPSFDYASSQVLLISRDRPATFRYL